MASRTNTVTETIRPSPLEVNLRNLRRTKPQYLDSFGGLVCRFGIWRIWDVIGTARHIWTTQLYHRIVELLENNVDAIRAPSSYQGVQDPHYALRCYMVGVDKTRASPHAAIICAERYFSSQVRRIVLKRGLLQAVGWGQGFLRLRAEIRQPAGVPPYETTSLGKFHEVQIYLTANSIPTLLCGASIKIVAPELPSRTATLGGVIEADGSRYGMTVAHVFQASHIEGPGTSSNDMSFDEDDLDVYSVDNDSDLAESPGFLNNDEDEFGGISQSIKPRSKSTLFGDILH
jgi:hypothetical protein